jgi:hypothetical protein
MPSFEGALSPEDLWNVASYVWGLRGGATASGGATEDGATSRAEPPATGRDAPGGSGAAGLDFALQLEAAFADVADRVFPSVVSIGAYLPIDQAPDASTDSGEASGWRAAGDRNDPYPGHRLVRSRSGFFISEDGFILTNAGTVAPFEGREIAIVDVEIEGRHYQARVVGTEPTVDLAVLAVDLPFSTRAVKLSEGLRQGRSLGDRARRRRDRSAPSTPGRSLPCRSATATRSSAARPWSRPPADSIPRATAGHSSTSPDGSSASPCRAPAASAPLPSWPSLVKRRRCRTASQ